MTRCTAPKRGHRTASGRANCPRCGGRGGYGGGYVSYTTPAYRPSRGGGSGQRIVSGSGGGARSGGRSKASWSRAGSTVTYTPAQIRTLEPVRRTVEVRAREPDLRDVFLCHAWDDRKGAAKELYALLQSLGVSVWFSEQDVPLGTPLLREIDRGLARSRVGIVLVTPNLLSRLEGESIADKELSVLLQRDLLVPVVHDTTYEDLREVSPMLASRSGLSTAEETMPNVAAKLAELVDV